MAGEDRYRLAPVRETRERTERVKRGELASAVDDTRDAAAQVAAIHARTLELRGRLTAVVVDGPTARELAIAERYRSRLRGELAAIAGELDRAEAMLADRTGIADSARGALARARADREVIERHFARWRDAQRKIAERRED